MVFGIGGDTNEIGVSLRMRYLLKIKTLSTYFPYLLRTFRTEYNSSSFHSRPLPPLANGSSREGSFGGTDGEYC